MERRKAKSVRATAFPEEADPFNAKRALQEGDECGVGYFVRDHAETLSVLADLFDPTKLETEIRMTNLQLERHDMTFPKWEKAG
jgi:hypothetical protein